MLALVVLTIQVWYEKQLLVHNYTSFDNFHQIKRWNSQHKWKKVQETCTWPFLRRMIKVLAILNMIIHNKTMPLHLQHKKNQRPSPVPRVHRGLLWWSGGTLRKKALTTNRVIRTSGEKQQTGGWELGFDCFLIFGCKNLSLCLN